MLPNFVQPAFLWALVGLAIPVIIHLLFRRKSRRVDLGTLRFLRIVLEENARRRKLKRWLLLALRLGCLALIAGLFARPFFIDRGSSGRERLVAILIDRSASMELKDHGQRLIDLAVEQARDVIAKSGEKTQIEVAFFDQAVRPLGGGPSANDQATNDKDAKPAELLALLKAPEVAYSATNYGAALAWARDVCTNNPNGRREVYIFTDMQRSGLDWTNVEPLPPEVEMHVVDLGRTAVNNVALTTVQAARRLVRPGEPVALQAGVFNAGPFPLEKVPAVLTLESGSRKHVLREKVSVEPQASGTVSFEVPALGEGLWRGTVRIEIEDDLAFDNQRFVGLLCSPAVGVLLVDGDPGDAPQLSETYFLEMALRLAPPGQTYAESPFRPTTATTESGSLPSLASQQVVVLANVRTLSKADAGILAKFVEGGGALLVFTGDHVEQEGYAAAAAAGLTVGEIGSVARAHELPHRFDHWDVDHPLFEPFNDPQHGDLRRFAFSACTRITPADDANVIAWFRGNVPALVEKRLGKGRVMWFTAACDREWSDWTRSRMYLPLMHQVLGSLAGLTGGGPVRDVLIDSFSGSTADVAPGVYERDGFVEVVNTGPRESEIERCTAEEFARRFQLPAQAGEDQQRPETLAASLAFAGDLRDDEQWHWVVLILVGTLLVEGFVANRTAA